MDDENGLKTGLPVAKRTRVDLIFGIIVVVLSGAAVLWLIPGGVQVPASVQAAALSPAFLPYILTALIGAMGVVCIIQATVGRGVPKEDSELTFTARRSWPLRLFLIGAIFTAIYLLPDIIGMLPVAVLVMALLIFAGGERNLMRGVVLSVLLPLAVWLFFTRVAQVPLPEGILEEFLPL